MHRVPLPPRVRETARAGAALPVVTRSVLFDRAWYELQRGRRFRRRAEAALDWLLVGRREGMAPHPLLEPSWWDPRPGASGRRDPVSAYRRSARPHAPHPLFDAQRHVTENPGSVGHPDGPLGHWLETATAASPLPTPDLGGERVPLRWGEARPSLERLVRSYGAGPVPPSPAAGLGAVPGRTSVLLVAGDDVLAVRRCVDALLGGAGGGDVEVVVVAAVSARGAAVCTGALALLTGRVEVVLHRGPLPRRAALELALARARGDVVVVADPAVAVHRGWVPPLRAGLGGGGRLAAPVLLRPDGVVRSAGLAPVPHAALPAPVLHGLPLQDAQRAGVREVAGVEGLLVAVRSADLAADLALGRGAGAGQGWPAGPCPAVVDPAAVATADDGVDTAALLDAGAWAAARAGGPFDDAAWRANGLAATGVRSAGGRGGVPLPVPTRLRPPGGGMRWALKIGTRAGPRAASWGDWHFAGALGDALERAGQQVVVDCREAHERETSYLDDVVLCLRGLVPVEPPAGAVSLLWVISHPELVTDEELRAHDAVWAASPRWAAAASARSGREVGVLLQATDPARFHPDVAEPDTGEPVLFLGNSRGVDRPVVRHLVDAGVEVAVHGEGWERFLDPRRVRAQHVPNEQVPALYRSCGVVLNDHWPDMREQGFLSNRLFDAAATGARVVSDDVEGVEELFGGLVRTFDGPGQLLELVRGYGEAFPGDDVRRSLAGRVAREHSFDARAAVLLQAARGAAGG